MNGTVLVTRIAGGIGRAVATRFVADGAVACGVDLTDPHLDGVDFRPGDVTSRDDVERVAAAATAAHGGIDVLVTCAGLTAGSPLHTTGDQDWDDVVTANLTSAFLCIQAVLPGMVAAGRGAVVTLGSVLHRTAAPGLPAYAAAKGAIAALTRQLTVDYGRHGVTFVTVSPGWIRTPATESRLADDTDLERLRQSNPMRLIGEVADVAESVAYAASPAARLISGTELVLDGGASVTSAASLLRDDHRDRMGLPPLA